MLDVYGRLGLNHEADQTQAEEEGSVGVLALCRGLGVEVRRPAAEGGAT